MNKSKHFSGQPIIKQLLKFMDVSIINRTARKHDSDRYYKRFKTYDHVVSMLFAALSGVNSLRELSSVMLACEGKINHLNMKYFPRRSTISDANKRRSSEVFGEIYHKLLNRYAGFLSDSSSCKPVVRDLKILDSTTISLFSDILKGPGRHRLSGKKKGGIKMHTMIHALEDVPRLVRFSSAARHDHTFLKDLHLAKGSFVVFDKGYTDYKQYHDWNIEVFFVTRQKDNAVYEPVEEFDLAETVDAGVIKDEQISLEKDGQILPLRRIAYYHSSQERTYIFITNNYELPADKIADIYKQRWQIETMFKRLKQNFPLKYFLGDTQNAIEIQIWISLIAQLLMLVVQRKARRRWAFSNMVSVIRYHLMSYIDVFEFLRNPDQNWSHLTTKPPDQLSLFHS